MKRRWALLRRLDDERGSALVVAGIMAVAMVLMGAVIVEVGQWYEHRRDIQMRADAAALAGGQVLRDCFSVANGLMTEAAADSQIEGWARSYGGVTGGLSTQTGAPYNPKFGTSSSDQMSFQSNTYPSSANPAPTRDLGPECFNADGSPNLSLDVKMTQAGIPPIFSISPLATVHGWARTQLQEIESVIPTMPLVPPDVDPSHVAVTFVNDSTGQALNGCPNSCVFSLSQGGPVNGLNMWGGSASIPVVAGENIGMRVSIGNVDGSCAGVNQAAPSSTTHYRCYVYNNSGNGASPLGIIRIRGYQPSSGGAVSTPTLRGVEATTCSGQPFYSIVSPLDGNGNCSVTVTAGVDFPASDTQPHVRATINGTNVVLTAVGPGDTWASDPSALALPVGGGPYDVTMAWCNGTCSGNNGWTSFAGGNPVQQVFSGNDGSNPNDPAGPILAAWVLDSSSNPAYTLPDNTSTGPTDLTVSIGLYGGVRLSQPCTGTPGNPVPSGPNYSCATDPPKLLRLVTSSSQNFAIDCGTIPGNPGQNANFYQQLRYGCANRYSINNADTCPDPTNTSEYPDCATVQTGGAVGQAEQAMDERFAPGGVCDPNYYPYTDTVPNDPRIVTLLVTDFSAFSGSGGSGSQDVPIPHVATFYVTGWNTENNFNACNNINESPPPGVRTGGQTASIWGHFIKDYTGPGIPGGVLCKPSKVEPCALALVR